MVSSVHVIDNVVDGKGVQLISVRRLVTLNFSSVFRIRGALQYRGVEVFHFLNFLDLGFKSDFVLSILILVQLNNQQLYVLDEFSCLFDLSVLLILNTSAFSTHVHPL